jgi:multidrug efflux system outer membrane protein
MNTIHRNFRGSLACVLVSLLTGCMVGPNYKKPVAPVPPTFTGPPAGSSNSPDQSPIAYADWWKVFRDPTLNDLESQADAANRDIKIAVAHVDEAAATTRATRSQLFPTVTANPSAFRTREAQNRPNNGNTQGRAATFNDFVLPLVASYEIDAWGRVRRSIESSRATQEATEADLRFVTLSVETGVAVNYYNLRETDQKQALEIQRAQLEHALAVLLGRTAEGFSLPNSPNDALPPQIPIGLPADLLERRPDIVEADRNVAAATAQIGVAKAAYFPQLSLSGLAGYESSNAASLLNWQNTIASLGASAAAPIFTGGRLKAGVEQSQAMYRQTLAQYEKTVLVAYQETEDQLSALHFLDEQSKSQGRAVVEAQQAEDIATSRFKGGLVSYLDVVFAEQTVLTNERTEAQIAGQRMVASVVLIKTLGGGWNGSKTP